MYQIKFGKENIMLADPYNEHQNVKMVIILKIHINFKKKNEHQKTQNMIKYTYVTNGDFRFKCYKN